ncbi:hypothetical protein Psfp_04188 [Pelotomaculum sp. FP]|nr:hypothetical protein Psfp_04188 [Pelotomaculum sp. FP]
MIILVRLPKPSSLAISTALIVKKLILFLARYLLIFAGNFSSNSSGDQTQLSRKAPPGLRPAVKS